jgi:MYXO-CTERM domain-containing protein
MNKGSFLAMAMACATVLASTTVFAYSSGITGSATGGCSSGLGCHGAMNAGTSVQIMGPTTVVRGSMNVYELIITNMASSQTGAGLDVAASAGVLGTSAMAPLTQVRSGEITHRSPIARTTATTWRIPFTWTAPATAGSARINAAANAVNGDTRNSGDQWNTSSLAVTVTDTAMADGGAVDAALLDASSGSEGGAPLDASSRSEGGAPPPPDSGIAPPVDSGVVSAEDASVPSDGSAATDSRATTDSGVANDAGGGMMMAGCQCTTTPASTKVSPFTALFALASVMLIRRRPR